MTEQALVVFPLFDGVGTVSALAVTFSLKYMFKMGLHCVSSLGSSSCAAQLACAAEE